MKARTSTRHEVLFDRVRDRQIAHLARATYQSATDLGKPGVVGESPWPGPNANARSNDCANDRSQTAPTKAGRLFDREMMTRNHRSGQQQASKDHLDGVVTIAADVFENLLPRGLAYDRDQAFDTCREIAELTAEARQGSAGRLGDTRYEIEP
jgi:hypothetical protein